MSDLIEEAKEDIKNVKGFRIEFGWIFDVKLLRGILERVKVCWIKLKRGL